MSVSDPSIRDERERVAREIQRHRRKYQDSRECVGCEVKYVGTSRNADYGHVADAVLALPIFAEERAKRIAAEARIEHMTTVSTKFAMEKEAALIDAEAENEEYRQATHAAQQQLADTIERGESLFVELREARAEVERLRGLLIEAHDWVEAADPMGSTLFVRISAALARNGEPTP